MDKKYMDNENFKVNQITPKMAGEFILKYHYSHKMPLNILYAFGLFQNNILIGICSFGLTNTPNNDMLCGNLSNNKTLEINRVVISDNAPLNCASFLISKTLKFLKKNGHYKVIISYADTKMHHIGYIYQALNFYYIGISKGKKRITMKGNHPRTPKRKNSLKHIEKEEIITSDKHKYIIFIGNKSENKELLNNLKCRTLKYPKGKPKRYYIPNIKEKQKTL